MSQEVSWSPCHYETRSQYHQRHSSCSSYAPTSERNYFPPHERIASPETTDVDGRRGRGRARRSQGPSSTKELEDAGWQTGSSGGGRETRRKLREREADRHLVEKHRQRISSSSSTSSIGHLGGHGREEGKISRQQASIFERLGPYYGAELVDQGGESVFINEGAMVMEERRRGRERKRLASHEELDGERRSKRMNLRSSSSSSRRGERNRHGSRQRSPVTDPAVAISEVDIKEEEGDLWYDDPVAGTGLSQSPLIILDELPLPASLPSDDPTPFPLPPPESPQPLPPSPPSLLDIPLPSPPDRDMPQPISPPPPRPPLLPTPQPSVTPQLHPAMPPTCVPQPPPLPSPVSPLPTSPVLMPISFPYVVSQSYTYQLVPQYQGFFPTQLMQSWPYTSSALTAAPVPTSIGTASGADQFNRSRSGTPVMDEPPDSATQTMSSTVNQKEGKEEEEKEEEGEEREEKPVVNGEVLTETVSTEVEVTDQPSPETQTNLPEAHSQTDTMKTESRSTAEEPVPINPETQSNVEDESGSQSCQQQPLSPEPEPSATGEPCPVVLQEEEAAKEQDKEEEEEEQREEEVEEQEQKEEEEQEQEEEEEEEQSPEEFSPLSFNVSPAHIILKTPYSTLPPPFPLHSLSKLVPVWTLSLSRDGS